MSVCVKPSAWCIAWIFIWCHKSGWIGISRCTNRILLYFPESSKEVSRIHKLANRHGVPVIPYGGGTGSQGGAVPLYGGIIIDLKKMDHIIKIDETSLTVTAQPGDQWPASGMGSEQKGLHPGPLSGL